MTGPKQEEKKKAACFLQGAQAGMSLRESSFMPAA